MSDVIEANDQWVLATLKIDPAVLRTLPNGGAPEQPAPTSTSESAPPVTSGGATLDPSSQPGTGGALDTDLGLGTGAGDLSTGMNMGTGAGGLNTGMNMGTGAGGLNTGMNMGTGAGDLNTGMNMGSGSGGTVGRILAGGGGTGTGQPPGPGTVFDNPSPQGTRPDSGSGQTADTSDTVLQPAPVNVGPPKLSPEDLKQAMLAKMPLTTTIPEWAKGIDLRQAKLGKEIKSGSFGTTSWLDGVGGEKLVIKTGKPNDDQDKVLANCSDLAHEAEFYEKIGDHPNIAKCLGIQEIDGQRGLVLEGIRGKDMHGTMDRLEKLRTGDKKELAKVGRTTPLSQSEFVGMQQFMLSETLKGLAKLEESGVVHGDIRPDNIMVDSTTGGIKLVDLGIAFDSGTRPKIAPIFHGSVGPEYAKPGGVTEKFDVFSAGEIAHKGMERDQFRYGNTGPISMQGFKDFGDTDSSGNPLHQALNPQSTPVSTRPKDDYEGRLEDARTLASDVRGDNFVNSSTSGDSVISGDQAPSTQIVKSLGICRQKLAAYNKVKDKGGEEATTAAEELDQALTELERRVAQTKTTGKFGAETEYTKFVNWAMNPDPTKRPSAKEALEHPFLADSMMDEESARNLMRAVLSDT